MCLCRPGARISAVIGLSVSLLGADRALASPLYEVQDLGVYRQFQAQGYMQRINVDSQGNVGFAPGGGLHFDASATEPVPAGDPPDYTVALSSGNGLSTTGRAYDPAAHHFDGYTISGGTATLLKSIDPTTPSSTIAPYAVNDAGHLSAVPRGPTRRVRSSAVRPSRPPDRGRR